MLKRLIKPTVIKQTAEYKLANINNGYNAPHKQEQSL